MKKLIQNNLRFLLFTIAIALFYSASMLVVPIFINQEINNNASLRFEQLLIIVAFMLGSLVLQLILINIRENYAAKFNVINFKQALMKLFHLRYDEIAKRQPTSIIERLGMTTNAIYRFISNSFANLSSGIMIVIFTLLFAFMINCQVGLLLIIVLPINIFGYRKINKMLSVQCETMQATTANSYKELFNLWRHADFIKQYPTPQKLIAKSEGSIQKMYGSMAAVNKFAQSTSAALKFMNSTVQSISLLLVGLKVVSSGNGIATIVILSIILPLYFSALNSIVSTNLEVSELNTNLTYLNELDACAEPCGAAGSMERIEEIRFALQQISTGQSTIAANISLIAGRGDAVRISGTSGCGKSSLVRLLMKFRPCEGIFINGTDINHISNAWIRSRIRYVSQTSSVFPFSIRENILLATDGEPDWRSIENNPILRPVLRDKTLDTLILENGSNLSGGEIQRIALCRAMQGDFDVFILDEVTSNLDRLSAQEIYQDVFAQYQDKIIFVITHDEAVSLPVTKQIIVG